MGVILVEYFIRKPIDTDGVCFNTVCEYVDDDSFQIDSSEYYFKGCFQKLLDFLKIVLNSKTLLLHVIGACYFHSPAEYCQSSSILVGFNFKFSS